MRNYHRFSVMICLSTEALSGFAGNDAWTRSGNTFLYTKTEKISCASTENGGIEYKFSPGQPEYAFDSGTGSCSPGSLSYSPEGSKAASSVTGTVRYEKDKWPTCDTTMSMSGSLIPPSGEEGSKPTWSATAKLAAPFWLEASPANIVQAGKTVTITAKGDPTESTWTVNNLEWKDHNTRAVNHIKLLRSSWAVICGIR